MSYTILQGNALERLREMPDESVHCVVTSPPYWGLRDYGTASWDGGEADCSHTNLHGTQGESGIRADRTFTGAQNFYRDECQKCGAVRIDQQIGLEPNPAEYVAKMVAVFRELRRVLKRDGTAWVNLGDSYAGSWGRTPGLKPKDLVGIPWRVAFALQADGWWLRQDIIWHKPNPMPESVRDRCTKSHEYIFLLSKSATYFYDADAIAEPVSGTAHSRGSGVHPKAIREVSGWASGPGSHSAIDHNRSGHHPKTKQNESFSAAVVALVEQRNKRSVWTVASQPFPEAHFATFPEELIKPCILAGCPIGGIVLDPFNGSGTTGVVALRYHRNYIGIELSKDYVAMSRRRIRGDARLLNHESEETA